MSNLTSIVINSTQILGKLTSMVMIFNPKPALIISTVLSLPVPNTGGKVDSEDNYGDADDDHYT